MSGEVSPSPMWHSASIEITLWTLFGLGWGGGAGSPLAGLITGLLGGVIFALLTTGVRLFGFPAGADWLPVEVKPHA